MLPENAPPADFETDDQHCRRLLDLVSDLHSIWHAVAHSATPSGDGVTYLGDSPRHAYNGVLRRGEIERENIVDTDPATAEYAKALRARLAAEMADAERGDT